MKRQITLDRFSFVKTKQRYEIHIIIYIYILNSVVFLCMHVVPWVLKRNN